MGMGEGWRGPVTVSFGSFCICVFRLVGLFH